ncbi:hypothetical protein KGQ24_03545 [Patescibacteria group bacterium]|nr:hypothetical protein [Patescibacteria group bacterium]
MKKYKEQIARLRLLGNETSLHPLRREQIKAAVLEKITGQHSFSTGHVNIRRRGKLMIWMARYSAVVIAGLGLVTFTAFASNSAKPGDVLFPVKKVVEQAQIALSPSAQSKAELQAEFAQRRLQELSQVASDKQAPQQFKAEVAKQTQTDINNAINTLDEVQKKLEDNGDRQGAKAVSKASEKLMQATQATQEAVNGMGIEFQTEDNMPMPAAKLNNSEDKHSEDKANQEKKVIPQTQQDSASTEVQSGEQDNNQNNSQDNNTQDNQDNNMMFQNNNSAGRGFDFNLFFRNKD